ncbi:MerR family transcriptional regulator [Lentzea sp.]|uniref:MerR family transcriptional regulator n=1 Tax=Lentzea sp. TaxID=56099 RepID=UPI002ED377EB
MWTLDELLDRVSAALTAEYPGAPNGRVRDVPDRRAVRWYATTGLVDRPSAMRGRTALYERRHLLQLVALKRLQSEGRTLADVQAELAGADDTALAAIARVPEDLLDAGDAPSPDRVRPRFWAEPAAPRPPAADTAPPVPPPAPAPSIPAPPPLTPPPPVPAPPPAPAAALHGVALGGGAVVLVPGTPTRADVADIAAAARPLLDLLAARGLLMNERDLP